MTQPFHVAFLIEELRRKQAKNPRYSLRAFATFLEVHPSALSRILSGRQEISVLSTISIVNKLKLSPEDQERFVLSVAEEKHKQTLSTLNEGTQIDRLSAALRESELRYEKIMNVVDQALSIQEMIRDEKGKVIDTRILRVNPFWEDVTGVSQSQLQGKTYSQLFPATQPEMFALYEKCISTQAGQKKEVYFVERDQWFDTFIVPLEGDRVLATGVNTTERRRQRMRQDYLLGLSHRLRDLFDPIEIQYQACRYLGEHLECSNVYFVEYDPVQPIGTIHRDFAAPGVRTLQGTYERTDIAYRMNVEHRAPVIIDDTESSSGLTEPERSRFRAIDIRAVASVGLVKEGKLVASLVISNQKPRTWRPFEIELLRETAEITWSAFERGRSESALRKNESALRISENRLALVIESLPLAVGITDESGKLILSNAEMRKLLPGGKIPSQDSSRAREWTAYDDDGGEVSPDNFPGVRALRGQDIPDGLKMIFTTENGIAREVLVSSRTVRDPLTGQIIGTVITIR